MLNLGQIVAHLGLDAGGFQKGIADAESALGSMGKMLLGFTAAAQAAAGMAVHLASDVGETQSLAVNAFGVEGAKAMETWAAATGDAVGRTTQQMRQAATGIQAVLAPTQGLTEQTRRMSQTFAQLSVDLGSAFNTGDAEAMAALKSGIMGQTEPLMKYGVAMNQAALQTYAFQHGITQSVESMTEAQKQVLRYNFIIDATKIAHNDAAETAGSLANQMKAVEAGTTELATRVGSVLLPQFQAFTDQVLHVINYLRSLDEETIKMAVDMAASVVKVAALTGAALLLAQGLLDVGRAVKRMSDDGAGLVSFLAKLLTGFAAPLGVVLLMAAALAAVVSVVLVLRASWSDLKREMEDGLGNVWTDIKEKGAAAITSLAETITKVLQGIFDAPLRLLGALIDGFATLQEKIGGTRMGKAMGLSVDPQAIAELRETAAMLKTEHVEIGASMKESWQAIKEVSTDAGKATVDAWKTGGALVMGDIKNLLQSVLPDGVMSKIDDILAQFGKKWDAADPSKKRAAGVSATIAEMPVLIGGGITKVDFSAQQAAMALFAVAPSAMSLATSLVALNKIQVDELGLKRALLATQGKELQEGTDAATQFATSLRGTNEALKGGDWANMVTAELTNGVANGVGSVNWARLFTGAAAGGLEKFGQQAIQQVAGMASGLLDSDVLGKVAGAASDAVGKIAGMGANVLGLFASFASGLADTVVGAVVEGVKLAAGLVQNALSSTAGVVGSSTVNDPRMQAALGAGMAAFTALAAITGTVFLAFVGLAGIMFSAAITLSAVMMPQVALVALLLGTLTLALGTAVSGLMLLGGALVGVAMGIFVLATKTASYERFQKGVGLVVDRLIAAVEPLFQRITPLIGVAHLAAGALAQLVGAILPSERAARGLFDVFQLLAAGGVNVVIGLLNLRIAAIGIAMVLVQVAGLIGAAGIQIQLAFALVVVKMMDALAKIPGVSFSDDQWAAARGAVDQAYTNMATQGAGVAEQLAWMDKEMRAAMGDRNTAMDARTGIISATYDEMGKFTSSIIDATAATTAATESLSNVPSGYKVALARFNNARDISGGMGPNSEAAVAPGVVGSGVTAVGGIVFTGPVVIQANNPEELGRALENQASRAGYVRTGSTNVRPTRPYSFG